MVSAVIPVYNGEATIQRALDSIAAQTKPPREIVVVDDGSTDSTCTLLQSWRANSTIPVVELRQRNQGEAAARNAGLRAAQGEFVAFLDSDDAWHPRKLELVEPQARLTGASITFHGYRRISPSGVTDHLLSEWSPLAADVVRRLVETCVVTPSTVVAKRSAILNLSGFDEQIQLSADWDMWLRLAAAGERFEYVPRILMDYYWHGSNMSSDAVALVSAAHRVLDKFFDEHGGDPEIGRLIPASRARWHLESAIAAAGCGDAPETLRQLARAGRARPAAVRLGWMKLVASAVTTRSGRRTLPH